MNEIYNMAEYSVTDRIQAVLNTLPLLAIQPTFDNVNRMTGIYNALVSARDELIAQNAQEGSKEDAGDDCSE